MSTAHQMAGGHQPSAITLAGVSKAFSSQRGAPVLALSDISLTVGAGEFVSVLGPSGCGKTTLLRLMDGLIAPDTGTIEAFGAIPKPSPRVGFMFQSFRLIPWATVMGNVEFALRSLPISGTERRERAARYVELVGLSRFAAAYPHELSGGMKQRVALARAFCCEPELMLMDEPFASIDAQTRELMQIELMRLWTKQRSAVVFVTHSVDEALLLSDRIVLMGPRPGRVMETIPVELPRPRWDYDIRAHPRFIELRQYLSQQMYALVMNDPHSDFFGRDLS